MDLFSLALRITEQGSDKALAALDRVDAKGEKTALTFGKLGGMATAAWGAVAGSAVLAGLLATVSTAGEADEAVNRLRLSVENAGESWAVWGGALNKAADDLMAVTKFGDEDAREAMNRLISMTNSAGFAYENLGLAADLATAKQMDLVSAAELIGKAATGNTAMLKRYGIIIEEGADAMEVLREKFKGFAEEEGKGVLGMQARLANGMGEVVEAIGHAVVASDTFANGGERLNEIIQQTITWVNENADAITALTDLLLRAAQVIGGVVLVAVQLLGKAFQGWQMIVVSAAAGFEQFGQRGKYALGALLEDVGSFASSFARTWDRLFGTNLEDSTDRIISTGTRMKLEATRQFRFIQTAYEDTIAKIAGVSDAATTALATPGTTRPVGGAKGGGVGTPADVAPTGGFKLKDIRDTTALRLAEAFAAPLPVEIPLQPYVPTFAEQMYDAVSEELADVGPRLAGVLGDTIGGAFEGGFDGAKDMALRGLGTIMSTMGQTMLTAGLAMVKLLPALSNPFTSGPALIAAGAILLGLGGALRGAATGKNGGGSGGRAVGAPSGVPSGGEDRYTRYILGPTSAERADGLSPLPPMHFTVIGENDVGVQRTITNIVAKASRRGI